MVSLMIGGIWSLNLFYMFLKKRGEENTIWIQMSILMSPL